MQQGYCTLLGENKLSWANDLDPYLTFYLISYIHNLRFFRISITNSFYLHTGRENTLMSGTGQGDTCVNRQIPYQRTKTACLNCRKRKSRCEFDRENDTCKRCREYHLSCDVPEFHRRGGYANVIAGRIKSQKNGEGKMYNGDRTNPILSKSEVLANEMYNANDAIEILNRASFKPNRFASRAMKPTNALPSVSTIGDISVNGPRNGIFSAPSAIYEGILTPEESFEAVSFFFSQISPFYAPFIPSEYLDMKRLSQEQVLFAVVCLIGARCYDVKSHCVMHEKLWERYCEILGRLMLDCPDSQVPPLLYAMIVMTEWFPGVFLRPSEIAGGALRSYTRICWPIYGHVTRLAQYTGYLDHDIPGKLAVYYTDHLLSSRLGQRSMLDHTSDMESQFPFDALPHCSIGCRARVDLLKLFHLVNHTLYRSRKDTKELVKAGHHLHILRSLQPVVERWKIDYSEIFRSKAWPDRATIFEFCHFELYLYAVVLIPWQSSRFGILALEETREFLNIAIDAAKYIVRHETSPDRPVRLEYSPIGWITRLLHASVFLSKTLLIPSICRTAEEQKNIISTLRKAATVMAVLPPEDHYIYSRPINRMLDKFESQRATRESTSWSHNGDSPDSVRPGSSAGPSSNNGNIWDMLFNDEVFRALDGVDNLA